MGSKAQEAGAPLERGNHAIGSRARCVVAHGADELASRLEVGIREARPEPGQRAPLQEAQTSGEKVTAEPKESADESDKGATQRKTKSDLLKALEGMR